MEHVTMARFHDTRAFPSTIKRDVGEDGDDGDEALPPGILQKGAVIGSLARKASESRVRDFAGWEYSIAGTALAERLTLSGMKAFNIPDCDAGADCSDPFLVFKLLDERCEGSVTRTPWISDVEQAVWQDLEVEVSVPENVLPTLLVELWDKVRRTLHVGCSPCLCLLRAGC